MEDVPFDNISMKNECICNISKRNIDQTTAANGDELIGLSNKRSCIVEKMKFHLKDSIQSLKTHNNTESIIHIQTHRLKPMPIIFHYASDDIMDIQNCESDNMVTGLNSIDSASVLPTHSINDFCTIPMKKSLQLEPISSHPIDSTFTNNSSLSISTTSLDRVKELSEEKVLYRSFEQLQANYHEYLVSREAEIESSMYQQQSSDTQTYIRCQKHRQSIPVQIIPSDSGAKLCQFIQPNSLSQTVSNNALLKVYRIRHKKSLIFSVSCRNKS